jgi:signal transduction histidine kinase
MIIYRKDNGTETKYNLKNNGLAIYGLEIDKEGYIWFIQEQKSPVLIRMSPDGSWVNLNPPDDSLRIVSCIKLSPEKDIFIGGQGNDHYLFKYDYQTKKLQNLSQPLNDEQYKNIRVTDMAFDSTNHIILATTYGLWINSKEQMLHFDLGEMTNDMIHSLTFDHKKQLWFTNANGISQIRGTDCITYNNNDGLPSKTCTFRTLVADKYGFIWAGTISGVAKGKIETALINTPKPVLLSANCSGDFINPNQTIQIATNDLLTFQFGTPVYPAKYLKYRYSLTCIGSEHDILDESSENLILSNLKQGEYQLTVQVRNHGNYLWSNPISITFEVKKLWYTRIWVISLLLLFILLISLIVISYLRWKNRKKTEKLEQIIEERTHSLQEQNEELIALNYKLKEARDQAEQAIKSKDRFFSILAHDLKSPFNTLIGFAQLLVFNRDELSNEDMQHLLDEMLSTSENTYKLLQNLLDWARSQTGAIKMKNQPFYLNDLIDDVLKVTEPSARQKQISIKVEADEKIKMVSDVLFLTTVIRNLVANSIKFSFQDSSISIQSRLIDHAVEIKIKDQGVGIPEDKIPELFSIEHSYSTSGTANEKGTGLGLILCYEFISKMGGSLSVESKLGHGSTFTIKLPQEVSSQKNQA